MPSRTGFIVLLVFLCLVPLGLARAGWLDDPLGTLEKKANAVSESVGKRTDKWFGTGGNASPPKSSSSTQRDTPKNARRGGDGELGTHRANLRVYSGEKQGRYALEGAAYGALTGVALNCVGNVLSNKKCTDGAGKGLIIGAVGGAIVGGVAGQSADRKAEKADAAESRLEAARSELRQARIAATAAREVAAQREKTLAKLSRDAKKGEANRAALRTELDEARADRQSMNAALKRLEKQRSALESTAKKSTSKKRSDEYRTIVRQLKEQRDQLTAQIKIMDQAISGAA